MFFIKFPRPYLINWKGSIYSSRTLRNWPIRCVKCQANVISSFTEANRGSCNMGRYICGQINGQDWEVRLAFWTIEADPSDEDCLDEVHPDRWSQASISFDASVGDTKFWTYRSPIASPSGIFAIVVAVAVVVPPSSSIASYDIVVTSSKYDGSNIWNEPFVNICGGALLFFVVVAIQVVLMLMLLLLLLLVLV